MQQLDKLVSGDALRSIYSARSKTVDEKTIAANSPVSLGAKVAAEELDGWSIVRRNRRSVRMAKAKPTDRQLEDDVWALLCRMGFSEMNASRDFVIAVDDKSPPRQFDVFAKDDETVIVVECTHARDNGSKSVKTVIDKIGSVREGAFKAIHAHYGRDPKLKVKFAIATRNVDWRQADLQRAEAAQIPIITEYDLQYFSKLTDLLKTAARYQFLGRYFRGDKIEGLRNRVPATRGKAGGTPFYTFLISPHDLLRLAYISHRSRTSNDDLDSYQRMVKPARLANIGRFIDGGGRFPTNIVVNIRSSGLQFEIQKNFGDTSTGILNLPAQYGTAWIIDGQHRLYGYAHASRDRENDSTVVSVLAYENLPMRDEIGMFIDINTQQVKVSRNLVNEIVSSMDLEDEDPSKRLDAIHARLALRLDEYPSSPLQNRILTVSQDRDSFRCLTLTSLADGVAENGLVGTLHGKRGASSNFLPGPLADVSGDSQPTLERAVVALSRYFALFSDRLEEHWRLGDAKGGYLCTNNGLRSLLSLFRRLILFVEGQEEVKAQLLEPEDLVERIAEFVEPIVSFFSKASAEDVARFRNRGSSLLSVAQNTLQMAAIIHEVKPNFAPKDVIEYMESRDVQGTKDAKDMIDEINLILYEDVTAELKTKFGEVKDAWWAQGVPKGIRIDCDKMYNENNCERDRWNYLFLSNYPDIVTYGDNWDLFKDRYNFYGKGKKADLVRWIGKVNKARTVTHHAEKGPLSRDEVEYVRQVHELVKRHIEGNEPLKVNHRYIHDDKGQMGSSEAAAA